MEKYYVKIRTIYTSMSQNTGAPTRKMNRLIVDGEMSNRELVQEDRTEVMMQMSTVAIEVSSMGIFKKYHGAKTNRLVHNWPWGQRKRKF